MVEMTVLSLAVGQPVTVAYDLAANARAHAAIVDQARADVVVFPELSLTGYHFDAEPVTVDDPRLDPLSAACRRAGTVALVGAPIAIDGGGNGRHIGMLACTGTGREVVYRKMYLGADEAEHFVPGPEPAVIDVAGWRIGLAVCKDTGVPEHAATTAALGIDVYAAGVLESIDDAGVQPDRARRITGDHGVWVAIAAYAGTTGEGFSRASGGSGIWRPDGTPAISAGTAPGTFARLDLTPVGNDGT
jgi:predicted amidohydrolase